MHAGPVHGLFVEFDGPDHASLGFATDLGRPTDELVRRLHGVGTLAIESNYCPVLQRESPRPGFLKARIMGGAGHMSNEQCAKTVALIALGVALIMVFGCLIQCSVRNQKPKDAMR